MVLVVAGKWWPPAALSITGPPALAINFRAIESAFLSGSMDSEVKGMGFDLVDICR